MRIIITENQYRFLLEQKKSQSILFVGDSHTVDLPNYTYSGMFKKNRDNVEIIASEGKNTSWMRSKLSSELKNKHYDKVVIWGGNNDMFSLVSVSDAISNIQDMVNMVNQQGGKAYVIVGYNQKTFSQPYSEFFKKYPKSQKFATDVYESYREKYIKFQEKLSSSISGAIIIPAFNLDNSYTSDNIHGNASAQKEVFNMVSKYLDTNVTPSEKDTDDSEPSGGGIIDNLINYKKNNKTFQAYKTKRIPYEKEVEDIQTALQFAKCSLPVWGVDGKFGPETKKAVKCFQDKVGLEPTGVISTNELEKLISYLKEKNFSDEDLGLIQKKKTQSMDSPTEYSGNRLVVNDPNRKVSTIPSNVIDLFEKSVRKKYAGTPIKPNDVISQFKSGVSSIGVPYLTAVRQLYIESGFSPNVINCNRLSSAGAAGIAQFMPSTWSTYGGNGDVCDINDSLIAYVKYMGYLMKLFNGRVDLAIASYNSGPNYSAYQKAKNNNLDITDIKSKIPGETYNYVTDILQA